jgi:NAD(P)-dependent dehydrogenase (short-subunit alcohol dehydrogenase family)
VSVLDLFRLDGKVAIVTGASSGLGVSFAQALAEAGADVVVSGRRESRLANTAALIESSGKRAAVVIADVSSTEDCARVVDETVSRFGALDILVNNAGVPSAAPATRQSAADFRRVIEVNLCGSFWMAQACGRVMKRGSAIVNISSILGLTTAGLPQAAYSSAKAGVIGLTRDLAAEWTMRKGIRVNCLAPGFFPSEMTELYEPKYLEDMGARILSGRLGDPQELAATLVWLVSDAAGYITGQTIAVDGGVTIT